MLVKGATDGGRSIPMDNINLWISALHHFAHAGTNAKDNITIPVPSIHVTSQYQIKIVIFHHNGKMSD